MPNKRRNYFIKKDFQAKFIIKFCILLVCGCLLMCGLIYYLSTKTLTTSFENLHLVVKSTADFMLPALVLSGLIVSAFVVISCIMVVLFISHRIAGPFYHFEKSLKEIAKGDLTVKTHFRKKDEMKVIADELNKMVASIGNTISVSKGTIQAIENEITSVKIELQRCGVPRPKVDSVLKPLREKLQKLKTSLSYFKI